MPTNRIWFKVRLEMLLMFASRNAPPGKISVSPLAGIPAKPQFALSSQLAVAPLAPDQERTAALAFGDNPLSRPSKSSARMEKTSTRRIWAICWYVFFMAVISVFTTGMVGVDEIRHSSSIASNFERVVLVAFASIISGYSYWDE